MKTAMVLPASGLGVETAQAENAKSLLVEVESFADRGGWVVDQQFIDTNKNGQTDVKEYDAFQDYKARNPDWQTKRPRAQTD